MTWAPVVQAKGVLVMCPETEPWAPCAPVADGQVEATVPGGRGGVPWAVRVRPGGEAAWERPRKPWALHTEDGVALAAGQ